MCAVFLQSSHGVTGIWVSGFQTCLQRLSAMAATILIIWSGVGTFLMVGTTDHSHARSCESESELTPQASLRLGMQMRIVSNS